MNENELLSTRIFNNTPEKLWEAWSNPKYLKLWWGPKGFTNSFETFDFRVGGTWKFVMHSPDGVDFDNESRFLEIVELERIVLEHIPTPQFRLEVDFKPISNGTELYFKMIFADENFLGRLRDYLLEKNQENFDRLETVLADMQ